MSGKKEIKIVLHTPQKQEDIVYLQNIHNEMAVNTIRKKLQTCGATKKEKEKYLKRVIETI